MVRQLIFGGGDIYVEIMIMLKASLAVTRQLFGSLQSILVPDNRKPRCLPMNEGFFRVSAVWYALEDDIPPSASKFEAPS
ncbi:hypothetical protein PGT21_030144 [Puccinia graminis f. sp. tritici]|uniref:Uncharacterized protein n=1 Tax=Puccinia graminis f. sp. tritici TaxID=56615 RepID=A0A5B0Q3Z2_PUCGR|nr:hypothetical protein PGT21_030144 [Puccinia graminis f. sp. tritici]KAA1108010.1 hypothetical protein PGTUg99_023095 [Puccinia graminis f. sp. tritici]